VNVAGLVAVGVNEDGRQCNDHRCERPRQVDGWSNAGRGSSASATRSSSSTAPVPRQRIRLRRHRAGSAPARCSPAHSSSRRIPAPGLCSWPTAPLGRRTYQCLAQQLSWPTYSLGTKS
jgi:hypothetical protein